MKALTQSALPVAVSRLVRHRRDLWNKCDECGRLISFSDIEQGKAIHRMKTPDSDVSYETWETLCRNHYLPNSR